MVHPGDFLLTNSMSFGRPYIMRTAGCIHDGWLVLSKRIDNVDSDFFFHLLGSAALYSEFERRAAGATVKNLNIDLVKSVTIPLPPLAEQKRIAGILDAADALRAKRRESFAHLDSLLQSTFLTLFGDPVSNPMGWEKTTIGEIVENIDSGWSPSCLERPAKDDEWGVLKLGAVTYCKYRDDQTKALPPELAPRPEIEVKQGDLLFARKNTYDLVAACAYVHATRPKLLLPDLIFRLRLSKTARAEPIFMWQQLIVPRLRKHIQSFAGGAAGSMPNISKAKLRTIEVVLPPLPLQRRFAAIVESVDRQKARQRAHLAELDALFAALQHRAFRGEL
jgi:type I restriction enzyme S subunit